MVNLDTRLGAGGGEDAVEVDAAVFVQLRYGTMSDEKVGEAKYGDWRDFDAGVS